MQEDWATRLLVGRASRRWSQERLAEECAKNDQETAHTWRELITHIELGRALPAPRQAAILKEALSDEPTPEQA